MKEPNLKLSGDWHKPIKNNIHPKQQREWIAVGAGIILLWIIISAMIVGVLKLVEYKIID